MDQNMKSLSFDRVLTEELKCFWHKIWNLTIECPVASKAEAAATNFADGRIRKWQKSLCHVVLPLLCWYVLSQQLSISSSNCHLYLENPHSQKLLWLLPQSFTKHSVYSYNVIGYFWQWGLVMDDFLSSVQFEIY